MATDTLFRDASIMVLFTGIGVLIMWSITIETNVKPEQERWICNNQSVIPHFTTIERVLDAYHFYNVIHYYHDPAIVNKSSNAIILAHSTYKRIKNCSYCSCEQNSAIISTYLNEEDGAL